MVHTRMCALPGTGQGARGRSGGHCIPVPITFSEGPNEAQAMEPDSATSPQGCLSTRRHHSTGRCPRLKRLPFTQSLHFKNYPVCYTLNVIKIMVPISNTPRVEKTNVYPAGFALI